ncbi:hypothetical protein [Spongiivirga citrea]|nr:hypothetical protein [Spongiivirga citrea]
MKRYLRIFLILLVLAIETFYLVSTATDEDKQANDLATVEVVNQ